MAPQNGGLLLDEALRVGVHGSRAEIELVPLAIGTLAAELSRLEPLGKWPETVVGAVAAGENVGIQDALVAIDWLYVHYRLASDRHHAAEAEKVRLVSGQS